VHLNPLFHTLKPILRRPSRSSPLSRPRAIMCSLCLEALIMSPVFEVSLTDVISETIRVFCYFRNVSSLLNLSKILHNLS
jgi:hypothetical protein